MMSEAAKTEPERELSGRQPNSNGAAHPVANVQNAKFESASSGSMMWVVAVGCLALAIGLVWWSMPDSGHPITIYFPDGHGLEAKDPVRFRGIDVGVVDKVQLNSQLSGVDVTVMLKPFAKPLARAGTRFWIVRPEVSISGITGLETAVGHKYIGLMPGDIEGLPKTEFDGLGTSPPDALEDSGIEIIVRGDRRFSVSANSPVTCRGVEVGRVLSVGLSSDARFVDIRARIFDKNAKLVNTKSKFWANSGLDMKFSLGGGFKLETESLETMARGGVSFLTIENGGQSIKPGHIFELYAKPKDEWLEQAKTVYMTDIPLRGALPMELVWEQRGMFGGKKSRPFNSIPFTDAGSGKSYFFVPQDVFVFPKKIHHDTIKILTSGAESKMISLDELPAIPEIELASTPPVIKLPVDKRAARKISFLTNTDVRGRKVPEECLAVRAMMSDGQKITFLHYPIELSNIGKDWSIASFDGDKNVWHGAPVFANNDGKLIGILLVDKRQARIVEFAGEVPQKIVVQESTEEQKPE